jgi:hypothetical protein
MILLSFLKTADSRRLFRRSFDSIFFSFSNDYAFKMLIADIHEDLTVRKQAFLMTQLLQKYLDYLPEHIPYTYHVTKLQET